jgi:hypothetical protein
VREIAQLEAKLDVISAEQVDWVRFADVAKTPAPPVSQRTKANIGQLRDECTWKLMMLYKQHGPLKKLVPLAKWMLEYVKANKGNAGVQGDTLPTMLLGVGLFYQLGGTHAPYDAPELWQAFKFIENAFKNDEAYGNIGPKNTLLGKGVLARICRIRGDDAKCESLLEEIQDWLDGHPLSMSPVDARHMLAEESNWDRPDED